MNIHDFLVCTFTGDTTLYVAEILVVNDDSFECRFVHTENHYTFSTDSWEVLKSAGSFPKGTLLTTHELYTKSEADAEVNSFVAVTFQNGKKYLGRLVALDPQVVRFLHKGIPVYVFEDNKIINSGGIYPKGQSIISIETYELVTENINSNTPQIDTSQKGISYNGSDFNTIATEIQGNILKSHGRDHTSHIFFKFNSEKNDQAKSFIKDFAETKVTTALSQKLDSDKIIAEKKLAKQEKREPDLEPVQTIFINFLLSADGYRFLDIDTSNMDQDFVSGMKNANQMYTMLFDNAVENWEDGYKNEIHGMILIAWGGIDRKQLDDETNNIIALLQQDDMATIIQVDKGDGIKNLNGDHIEHFGYVDGISQPKFFTEELSEQKDDGVQTVNWNPLMPLDLVLVKDSGGQNENSFGSYMVFRKLEQNVKAFKQQEIKLAQEIFKSSSPAMPDFAGALLVGRFKNGMPVSASNEGQQFDGATVDKTLIGKINDFNFSKDPDGSKCPLHAHIRKTNPRSILSGDQADEEKRHMMARRGITYGKRSPDIVNEPVSNMPVKDVGLLFMSFQASISKQFEYQQEVFANNNDNGKDPLIGQGEILSGQKYATKYGDASSITNGSAFGGFVTLKGGEYFFAPSMSFLTSIS